MHKDRLTREKVDRTTFAAGMGSLFFPLLSMVHRFGRPAPAIGMLLIGLSTGTAAYGQATDLIISEYVEGSGNNKYIEVYNGTGAAVNLADYQLQLFSNGSATAAVGAPAMTGILANGATIVYRNSLATLYGGAR